LGPADGELVGVGTPRGGEGEELPSWPTRTGTPLHLDAAGQFEPAEERVERASLDLAEPRLTERLGDGVAVVGPVEEDPHDADLEHPAKPLARPQLFSVHD